MGDVRFAADITVGVAVAKGDFAAFVLDADIPALLRSGALGSVGGQPEFYRDTHTSGLRGLELPLKVNGMGH